MQHAYTDKQRGPRLQKVLAEAGVASRRACEGLIAEGRVTVNGDRVETLPAFVDPREDRLAVDGREVARPRRAAANHPTAGKHYVMLHKPRGVISTVADEPGMDRRTVTDLVRLPGRVRLFPVGRLDADSTGLLLLTDDGELTQRLTHPRYGVQKSYRVTVRGKLENEDADRLRRGLLLTDRKRARQLENRGHEIAPRRAAVESVRILRHEVDHTRGHRTQLAITLKEGQNREIRRLLARLGFNVHRLERTSLGPLRIRGLKPGSWRTLERVELQQLRRAAGLASGAAGGKPQREGNRPPRGGGNAWAAAAGRAEGVDAGADAAPRTGEVPS
ncbi:pseudouridine synthase [Phycisphaera mikurensis]|uniref:Pseudouridine synthase n=1 Tax=Phycisphaera mikurensis (strain NBRC 102666 / KCTC 22515 / FYK2301M01) TaxID=1142394 RepID=I0IAQ3_PHYMF|nr:pseudouridine synthase [Phycisphaera mikurensis]MBB6441664.1 pseudouridine synthase [Phycisphaera mikurensis]BAM02341.1 ribosomal large subunit pseudouridine synthase B [Phycisphaera mikurensis NBRC 102666]